MVMVGRVRSSWFVLPWLVGCTSFGAEPSPVPDSGAIEGGAIVDAGSDAPAEVSLGFDAGSSADAAPDGPRYTCALPVVISSHTVPSDCERALVDSGCPKGAPPEGKPCAGGSVDPDVTSCACEGGELRRTTCSCR